MHARHAGQVVGGISLLLLFLVSALRLCMTASRARLPLASGGSIGRQQACCHPLVLQLLLLCLGLVLWLAAATTLTYFNRRARGDGLPMAPERAAVSSCCWASVGVTGVLLGVHLLPLVAGALQREPPHHAPAADDAAPSSVALVAPRPASYGQHAYAGQPQPPRLPTSGGMVMGVPVGMAPGPVQQSRAWQLSQQVAPLRIIQQPHATAVDGNGNAGSSTKATCASGSVGLQWQQPVPATNDRHPDKAAASAAEAAR